MTFGKILILSREKNSCCDIKIMLRKYGHEVLEENPRENILNEVFHIIPHIILFVFTGKEGEEEDFLNIGRSFKDDERTKEIPIITIFHDSRDEEKLEHIPIEMDDYISKPFKEKDFILKINNQLKIAVLQKNYQQTKMALEESLTTIQKQKIELEHNLTMASKIQEALIPKTLGNIPNCSFYWYFQPSGRVGGDIFDVFMLDEDHMGLYVIDVMGHGIASSMLAVALSEFLILDIDRGSPLKRKTRKPPYYEIVSPVEVVDYLNKRFPFTKYHHYFTIFYMVLNVKTGVGKYVRGAHPTPLLVKSNNDIVELQGYGTPVGFEFTEGYEEKSIYLDPGDHLIVYTDGLLELPDEDGNSIEYEGLIEYIKREINCNHPNHYLTYNINQLAQSQEKLKDDLSVLEMKWVKFI
ncbi:SpoIIE family protein phosphatase [Natronincola ferrireducens]|uniref:Stage 0 sporulation protein A homolog n=1 Tax=Natronincola ferrireducens TaxID=393762 RepID=A0A1G8YQB0_9FIRM|nr:SpoIIE family protein phosphatase [Natronincola ferrireducens]SDK04963.1 Stage II sporulation protein E (SpoIIE) [Natronincola ferrireducens]